MERAESMEFTSYKLYKSENKTEFHYKITLSDKTVFIFTEKLRFINTKRTFNDISSRLLTSLFDPLHIILGISYYKAFLPKQIILRSIFLTKHQADFFNTVYTKGLGEFFYKNKLNIPDIKFPFSDIKKNPEVCKLTEKALVAIGGGKDSILAAKLTEESGIDYSLIFGSYANKYSIQFQTARKLDKPYIYHSRVIDPAFLKLCMQNNLPVGHIPATAVNSFISLVGAVLTNSRYIIFANEKSAEIGSIDYQDLHINHQWSKSKEFEYMFFDYVKSYICYDLEYFSILRPLSELKIVEVFCKYKEFHKIFSSCNTNFKIQKEKSSALWCGKCTKCAFIYALLSAYLPKKQLISIFSKDLFSDRSLMQTYLDLLGIGKIKPFDCVGTSSEIIVALYRAYRSNQYTKSPIIKMFEKEIVKKINNIDDLINEVCSWGDDSHIPKPIKSGLLKYK